MRNNVLIIKLERGEDFCLKVPSWKVKQALNQWHAERWNAIRISRDSNNIKLS